MAKYKSRHKGSEIDNAVDKVESLAPVATTGSYKDLTDKPDIPEGGGADITVDESLSTTSTNPVQNKVITAELNKKGTYTKPNNGIPKSDLASDVQESLGKADSALQSFEEQYKGTVTSVKINGSTKNPDADGVVDLGTIEGGEGVSGDYLPTTGGTVNGSIGFKELQASISQGVGANNTGFFRMGRFDENGGLKMQLGNTTDATIQVVNQPWTKTLLKLNTAGDLAVEGDLTSKTLRPSGHIAVQFPTGEYIDTWLNIRLAKDSATWNVIKDGESLFQVSANGRVSVKYTIKANDYLDVYGISIYETFATKTELGDINAVLDAINGEVI